MKKQALLIGINEYQYLPGLKYARQDAEAVAESLKQNYCFSDKEVTLLTDARKGAFNPTDKDTIQDQLENLANQELDLLIFGFWGHGLFRNGQRYFCPFNVNSVRAEQQGLSFDELQEFLSKIRAKNTCLILDCCQTIRDRGEVEEFTVSDQTSIENAARDIVLKRKEQIPDLQSNVAILNSCKEGQSAYEWDERKHGLFTAHLLDAMNKRSNSVMQIASYISSNIEKTAMELGKEQTPFYKLEGDIQLPVETKSTPLITGDVFISYRHCNADLTAPIEAELKRRDISYFIDRVGINYGMEYSTVIPRAIKACKVLLVMWTKEADKSPDMLQEIITAKTCKKQVLPYKLGTFDIAEHDGLCYQLSSLSRCECEAVNPTPDSITELVNRIQLILDPSAPILVAPVREPKSTSPNPQPVDNDKRIAKLLAKEKQKKQKMLDQLLNEAEEALDKERYGLAISKCDSILKLEPNSDYAKELKSLCQSRLEFQKAEEERKRKEAEEAERKREEERLLEEKRKREENLRRLEEERKRLAEEAARIAVEERKRREEEAARKAAEERKRLEEEAARIAAEERKRREEEAARKAAEERKRLEEEAARIAAEERKRREEEAARIAAEEDERKNHDLSIPGTKPGKRKTVTVNGVEFAFRWCPAGTFMMGSPESEKGRDRDEQQHQVRFTDGFWMLETPVTQKQWLAVMDYNPSNFRGDNLPVEQVSWNGCRLFCKKCAQYGLPIELPTEAQWEYACRAGSTTAYFWGSALNGDKANCVGLYPCGTIVKGKYLKRTTPVGSYAPNAWKLSDMHGNVREWCLDWYGPYSYRFSIDMNPTGPSSGSQRVVRGGGWNDLSSYCRSACRKSSDPGSHAVNQGFRVVRSL